MRILPEFVVPESVSEARHIQDALKSKITLQNGFRKIETIAGVDVGYHTEKGLAHASIVVLSKDLDVVEQAQAFAPAIFPYIPGLLSFREIPAILLAISQLNQLPDMWMVDGQGIAHPRRLGIAAHLGVLLDMPAIGVAKSRLTGRFVMPGPRRGDQTPLMDGKEQIGMVVRTRSNIKPLFISPGHRVDMETATAITLQCTTRYRLPEPTRLADKFSKCKEMEFA